MANSDHPTISTRPHVIDMFHAALTTLPRGGAGNSEPQADADLAIDPALGSRIAFLLSRLYHGDEELPVTKEQPNGARVACPPHPSESRGTCSARRMKPRPSCASEVAGRPTFLLRRNISGGLRSRFFELQ